MGRIPNDHPQFGPVEGVALTGALVATAMVAVLAVRHGTWVWGMDLVIHLVLIVGIIVRRVRPVTSLLTTGAALVGLAALHALAAEDLGVTPLLLCAPLTLAGVTRRAGSLWWGAGGLAVGAVGALASPALVRPDGVVPALEKSWAVDYSWAAHVLLLATAFLWGGWRRAEDAADARARAEAMAAADAREALALVQERNRLAREMHDVLAHGLTVINVHAASGLARGAKRPETALDVLRSVRTVSREALDEVRVLVSELRDRPEGEGGAPNGDLGAVERMVARAQGAGLEVTGDRTALRTSDAAGWPVAVRAAVVRAAQEVLTNALRHDGQDARLTLDVQREPGMVRVRGVSRAGVSAPGDGANHGPPVAGAGAGLAGIRERAELLGGGATAGPGPDGFTVCVWLPV